MSDLANSCEYLNIDKTCAHLNDAPKAKTFRELKCENTKNITGCCYLCIFRSKCAISCKYLGQFETTNEPQKLTKNQTVEDPKGLTDNISQFESGPVAFCFSCNVEMAWTKTQFQIDNWNGPSSNILTHDKVLPVTVLLCLKCGKIEFKTNIIHGNKVL